MYFILFLVGILILACKLHESKGLDLFYAISTKPSMK